MAEGLTQLLKRALARRIREWADEVLEGAPAPVTQPPGGTATAAPSRQDDGPAVGDGGGAPRVWLDYVRERAPHLIVDGRFMPSRGGEPALELPRPASRTVDAPRARHDLAPPRRQEVQEEVEPPTADVIPVDASARTRRSAAGSAARPRPPQHPGAAEIVDWPRRRRADVAMRDRLEASSSTQRPAHLDSHASVDTMLPERPRRLRRDGQAVEGATVTEGSAAHVTPRAAVPVPLAAPAVSPYAALGEGSGAVSRVRPARAPAPEPNARPTTRPTTQKPEAAPRDRQHPAAVPPEDISRPSMADASRVFDHTRPPQPSLEPRDLWPSLPSRPLSGSQALARDLESRERRARLRREQVGEP